MTCHKTIKAVNAERVLGLVTILTARHRLCLGETKLRELMRDGLIDAVKIGWAVRITEASIEKFIEGAPRVADDSGEPSDL
jgi:hypothetical protein